MAGRAQGSKNARITILMVRRMRQLRTAGLSAEAVARLMDLDYGQRPHAATVRKYTDDCVPAEPQVGVTTAVRS